MHKLVVRWSYWIGMGSGLVALGWRGLYALGVPAHIEFTDSSVSYHAFLNAAVLFLLLASAAQSYIFASAGGIGTQFAERVSSEDRTAKT